MKIGGCRKVPPSNGGYDRAEAGKQGWAFVRLAPLRCALPDSLPLSGPEGGRYADHQHYPCVNCRRRYARERREPLSGLLAGRDQIAVVELRLQPGRRRYQRLFRHLRQGLDHRRD
ncbi:hypothetical protein DF3PA_10249 [Candidatus Defluviicoccus seviourii]|uniref:Uncharacterized protein n=2 Tax=root TaxID=1 RepID=A0A564WAY8_9PROT|nr:hypothetical protein DF3PB_1750002 [uncultured Defluviicoccus sp.]VUX45124.1 hypothetical protein DF3PA_10249 [Candidatus Defluviicoccus seviourii]